MATPAESVYQRGRTEPLADLRMMISLRPEALYLEARELSRLLRCSESEIEAARDWLVEGGLEAGREMSTAGRTKRTSTTSPGN